MSSQALSSDSEKSSLLSAISTLSEKIAGAVNKVREDFKAAEDIYEFLDSTKNAASGIRQLFVVSLYIECFESMGVKTRAELEKLWAKHYKDHKVREAVEELLDSEDSVREFAVEVEKVLRLHEQKSNPPAKLGQVLPKDLLLTDAETGQEMPLEAYWKGSKFTWFVFLRHFG